MPWFRRVCVALAAAGSVLVAGCAIAFAGQPAGEKARLRALLDRGAPQPRTVVGCSYASGIVVGATPSMSCVYFVRGGTVAVARGAALRLIRAGFKITCRRDHDRIEIGGSDGTTRVRGYTARGAVTFDSLSGDPLDVYPVNITPRPRRLVPRGFVALKIGADRHFVKTPKDDLMPSSRPCSHVR
jgi:hypothetical protein